MLLLSAPQAPARAQAAAPQTPAPAPAPGDGSPAAKPRPRIALVLSGGGARGFAHVGVLRVLQELRVPIDLVAGVSMGAVVGGAYASGRSVADMEQFIRSTDWPAIVADRPPRDELAFRRREDDLLLPSRIEFGVNRHGVQFPPGAAGNAALEAALNRLLPVDASDRPVDRLALPFRSVASDLLTGELVELNDTPLFMSVRASLAVPGVFAPVRVNGRLVVDGGLVRNLPVDIARAMGADVIIAVNVGTPLAAESELNSGIDVARQMLNILTEQNVQRSLKELGPADILIAPELETITFMNFGAGERAMDAGAQAARRMAHRLADLAVSPLAYAAFEASRAGVVDAQDAALPLARLEVRATPNAGSEALAAQLGLRIGDPLSAAQANEATARLFGSGAFERIEIDIRDSAGRRDVIFKPVEAEWAHSRLRVGVELVSDFADDNRFTLSAMHTLAWVNTWGAELRTLVRIGSQRQLGTQLWQPLAPGSDWFVAPSLTYNGSALDVYDQKRRSVRLGYDLGTASLAIGRQFSNWGQVQLGVGRSVGHVRALVPEGAAGYDADVGETAYYTQFQIDTLDSLALPSRGTLVQGRLSRLSAAGGVTDRGSSSVIVLQAFRLGGWDGHVLAEWSRSRSGLAPLPLGGFLRLSGTPRESVGARSVVLGRVVMAQRVGEMPPGLGGVVRIGYSLELGNGIEPGESLRLAELQRAGSAFVSVDTRFGPLFLAAGATRGTGSALYLFLGPFW